MGIQAGGNAQLPASPSGARGLDCAWVPWLLTQAWSTQLGKLARLASMRPKDSSRRTAGPWGCERWPWLWAQGRGRRPSGQPPRLDRILSKLLPRDPASQHICKVPTAILAVAKNCWSIHSATKLPVSLWMKLFYISCPFTTSTQRTGTIIT